MKWESEEHFQSHKITKVKEGHWVRFTECENANALPIEDNAEKKKIMRMKAKVKASKW